MFKREKNIIIIKALSLILEFFLSSICFLKEIVYKIDLNYDDLVSKMKWCIVLRVCNFWCPEKYFMIKNKTTHMYCLLIDIVI